MREQCPHCGARTEYGGMTHGDWCNTPRCPGNSATRPSTTSPSTTPEKCCSDALDFRHTFCILVSMSNPTTITIYSIFADCPEHRIHAYDMGRSPEPTWTGEVEVRDMEDVFRFFNRVDEEDVERLEAIGYHLPSLSVGDVVSYDGTFKIVASCGFEDIDEEHYTFIRTAHDHHGAARLVLRGIELAQKREELAAAMKKVRKGLYRPYTHHYYAAQRMLEAARNPGGSLTD